MRSKRLQRGATILEAMVAMGVLMIGAAGMVGLHRQSNFLISDARRTTRAASFAQDLVNQIELWDYTDPRLVNNAAANNDADLGDSSFAFQKPGAPPADHGELDLTLGGTTWVGLPKSLLDDNGMERYWNVAYVDDSNGNGTWDAVRIAVIVRWPVASGWRRIVFMTTKVNGGDVR
jgi:hypothetical protein